jgi:nitroreductase
MTAALPDPSLDQIFRSARTFNGWTDRPVEDATVREIYDLMKWGPTSANCGPARFVWVRSADGRATLAGLAAEPNTRPAKLGGWRVAELWTDAERLFAVFGLVAIAPVKGV